MNSCNSTSASLGSYFAYSVYGSEDRLMTWLQEVYLNFNDSDEGQTILNGLVGSFSGYENMPPETLAVFKKIEEVAKNNAWAPTLSPKSKKFIDALLERVSQMDCDNLPTKRNLTSEFNAALNNAHPYNFFDPFG